MIERLNHPALELAGIAHSWFTRRGGVSDGLFSSLNCGFGSGDDEEHIMLNRDRALEALGIARGQLCTAYQVHGASAVTATEPWPRGAAPQADVLVTTTPGLALGVLTADCAPVLLADGEARIVAATHAGWKGALHGVLEAAVEAMEHAGAARPRIVAVIGPCIAQDSYEVGPEFRDRFAVRDSSDTDFFVPAERPGHFRFDLPGYARRRLEALDLRAVTGLDLDTCIDAARFFSYRRATRAGENRYGRLLSAIALVG